MRQIHRSDRRSLGLFAPRQVYVRSGPVSQYVTLSRPLQMAVAGGAVAIALWLGLASYTALAKHWETVEQERELTRLESVSKTLRTSFDALRTAAERRQEERSSNGVAIAAGADLATELAEVKASRERATLLADAAAGEADALRREVALAYERIRELEVTLVKGELDETAPARLVGGGMDRMQLAGSLLEQVSCPVP